MTKTISASQCQHQVNIRQLKVKDTNNGEAYHTGSVCTCVLIQPLIVIDPSWTQVRHL
jgi:hypothetical protein